MNTATTELIGIKIPETFWYNQAEVWSLHREHVLFVFAWQDFLQDGRYPPEHRESGYVGGGMSTRNQQCSFTKPIELKAEVDERVKACGTTAADLKETIYEQWTSEQLENYLYVTREQLRALNQMCGFDRSS